MVDADGCRWGETRQVDARLRGVERLAIEGTRKAAHLVFAA